MPAGAPAVVVHMPAQVAAALAVAGPRGVVLLSAPGAAGSLGVEWFLALVEAGAASAAAAGAPAPWRAVLDCGPAPGHALAALRAGVRGVVLARECPGWDAVAAAAAEVGAEVWGKRPLALDLGTLDLRREVVRVRLSRWLAA